ncbi:metalloregulator ArsR/SmtB family transcription factor [Salipaludibacillus sp. LMS25]|jgi:ArsR family transcriptional regulator|uniref:ArsR/SmtB family transcription factor n=1 Tax=Salipaludibacillus sp. LMS25 TaxID=2924031 RepID=UPI0020D03256|nr:metalloregulator ArsR/SmtB family transcription factor [Salipaludibacillus sp. LMS25]UTR13336.1 metalloregulator ArsR/SmtB family transcription factor [Salipaludibacillus sp. LMS25]
MNMVNSQSLTDYAQLFKLMNDENRLKILLYLNEKELCVCNIIDLLDMSQPAVSQHLKRLRDASLIKMRSHGQWKFYSLNEEGPHSEFVKKILAELPSAREDVEALNSNGKLVICTTVD